MAATLAARSTEPFRIREAHESDLDALTDLVLQVQTLHADGRPDLFRPADPEALRRFLGERHATGAILLAVEEPDGGIAGYLLAEIVDRPQTPFQFAHTSIYVHHIAVSERSRRGGLGAALLDAIEERARQAGATTVRLDSWSFNADAHRFFEEQGFVASRHVFERGVGSR